MFFQLDKSITDALELVLLQLHSNLTRSQLEAYQHGNLQIKTRRFQGLGVLKCTSPLQKLVEVVQSYCEAMP
eukprot:1572103-Karenia_brevis.AAC.1